VIRAGSIGRDIVGKVKGFFIRRRGRGASSRLILGEITALWCQANRPASWALAKPYEKTGGWQGLFPDRRSLFFPAFIVAQAASRLSLGMGEIPRMILRRREGVAGNGIKKSVKKKGIKYF
jgi:hypothetical protein